MSRQWSGGSRGPGSSWSSRASGGAASITAITHSGLFTDADSDWSRAGVGDMQDPTTVITVASWVKVASYPNTSYHTIIGSYKISQVKGYWFYVSGASHGAEGRLTFAVAESGSKYSWEQGTTQTLSTGTWYHVAATWTATGDVIKFYVNGSLQTTTDLFAQTSPTTLTYNATVPPYIGSHEANSSYTFDGNIAYAAVWDSVLTAAEISYVYTNQAFDYTADAGDYASSANLQSWHKFLVTDAFPTVTDASTNSYDLVGVGGSPVIEEDGP